MTRWPPDSALRLQGAALELFRERGFGPVTVAEIAERAGVTERTFFRHFSDKREVLFAGTALMSSVMTDAIEAADPGAGALDLVEAAVVAMGTVLDARAEFARERQRVIMANPELHERELAKMAQLAATVAEALRKRGVAAVEAAVAAEAGAAILRITFERWVNQRAGGSLVRAIRRDFAALRRAAAPAAKG